MRVDFESAREQAPDLIAADSAASTLWHGSAPLRIEKDWVIGPGGLIDPLPGTAKLRLSAETMLDPWGRFS
jgi:hypothetical protein